MGAELIPRQCSNLNIGLGIHLFLLSPTIAQTMASKEVPIDDTNDIARHNKRSLSTDEEKIDHQNVEDVEAVKHEGPAEVRLSQFTKEEEEAVIRKLDWHLMPLIFVLYSLSVLDRSNLGNAKIAGMQKDIDLTGNRYAWLGTIFYISCEYLRTEIAAFALFIGRYSLSVDTNGMESISASSLGCLRSSFLGHCFECPSSLPQLGRIDGLPIPACDSRSNVRAGGTALFVVLLS